MSKLKYLNLFVAACGATVLVIGSIIGVNGVIKGEKNWLTAISFMLAGTGLQAAALDRFLKYQIDEELNSYLLPSKVPAPCRGCRNYHGVKYRGVQLICAIHPSGIEGNTCLDHEK